MNSQHQNHPSHHESDAKEPWSDKDVEIAREEILTSLLENKDLSDLTLQATDGTQVFVNRCILATRSPVFHRMLYGSFAEASKTVIDLGHDGFVLEGITNYIYTDRLPTLLDEAIVWNIDLVRFLITFIDAANYFALPDLRKRLELIALTEMNDSTDCDFDVAVAILATCSTDCGDASTFLLESALEFVKNQPKHLLDADKKALSMIHPSNIDKILSYDDLPLDEQSCFQILRVWANAEDLKDEYTRPNSDESTDWRNSRRCIAAEMTSHIRFEDIDARHLTTTVSESGLVTTEQLNEAFKTQALRACKKLRAVNRKWRGGPVWKSSESTLFEEYFTETLDCPILITGVHKWSIRIRISNRRDNLELGVASTREPTEPLEYLSGLELGVASTRVPIEPLQYLSDQEGGWALCNGEALHAIGLEDEIWSDGMPVFDTESIISFTLDLDGDGVLLASVDGDTPVELFSGMLEKNGEGFGFVPAVSCGIGGGSVEFLGFEEGI